MRLSSFILASFSAVMLIAAAPVAAPQANEAPAAADPAMVIINLPENASLKSFVDFVGARLELNILYDQSINGRQITLKTNTPIPAESLQPLLENILKINKMALVPTDVPGVLRVTPIAKLTDLAGNPIQQGEDPAPGQPVAVVSRIYKLQHLSPDRAEQIISPFVNVAQGAGLLKLPKHRLIVVTDYASNLERIERMLELADRPGRQIVTKFIAIEHLTAEDAATQVISLLEAQAQVRGDDKDAPNYALIADSRSNRLVLAAVPDVIETIEQVIDSIDVSLGLFTELYRLSLIAPTQLDNIVRELVGEEQVGRLYKSFADDDSRLLAVTATKDIHEQVKTVIETIDQPVPEAQSPVRFYKLQNADALVIAEALSGISGEEGLGAVSVDGVSTLPSPFDGDIPSPGEQETPQGSVEQRGNNSEKTGSMSLPDARVLAYEPMNMLIVIAPPAMQPIYEKLIKRLDTRRPQVLIEATIVAIDTTDEFELGVEFSRSDDVDGGTLLNFSQFGLSTADPVTGELTLSPGLGFNGALLSADVADVVIRALQRDVRSSVLTRPSVLVNDNAEGELETKDTEPFESINANNQVATTSFGGELETGTRIKVKPSISDGDFLKLAYSITVSSFAGERVPTSTGGTLPPGRSENKILSEVTIPDGNTIVVGGLTRQIDSETIQRMPILGEIPILEYAFSQRQTTTREVTLFVFLRPVILRDDKFEDLKVLSGTAAGRVDLPSSAPASMPVEIR